MTIDEINQIETKIASIIAHQLKSPVAAAGTMIKTLLGEYTGTLTSQQKDLLIRIDKRLSEAVETSRRIISIVNPESLIEKKSAPVDISLIIRHCHARYEEEAALKGISFETEINIEPIYVNANEAMITEIVNSLLDNALKYTPKNGILKVTLSLGDSIDDQRIILNISDSGIGIPDKNLEKIFLPFFRSAGTQGSTLPGSGLGLAFVKAMVNSLGGEIRAGKSSLGGAEFTVKFVPVKEKITEESPEIKKRMSVVIVGGVAAGPKAASKIIRLAPETEVTLIEKEDILSYSGCGLPYYISGVVTKKSDLLSTPVKEVRDPVFFQNIKQVNILNRTKALEIDRINKRVKIRNLLSELESWVEYDKLLLATGASPIIPEIDGILLKNIFSLNGIHDAEGIKQFLSGKKAKDVVIVGGGLIGLEMTEALVIKGCRVTIIEKQKQVFNILDKELSQLVQIYLESHGVRVMTDTKITEFHGENGIVKEVIIDFERIQVDMVVIAIGVKPSVKLAVDSDLKIGITGAIEVNKKMETSDPDIFAAGDCAECYDAFTGNPCYIPLGSTANKEGRIAAVNICGGNELFSGINGTIACTVFDFFISKTGLTEKEALEKGYDVVCTLTAGPDREHFMPRVKTLMLKLVVNKNDRRILGAQAIGDSKNFNKIDIISVCISGKMTIDEVANLDLCYAPAFSLAIDNIITAANVAKNKMNGIFESITSEEVYRKIKKKEKLILLDVRSHKEYEEYRILGTRLIPLSVLRARLYELPKDIEIITLSSISLRAYEAALVLKANNYINVKVMDGGIMMWPYDVIEGL